MYPKVDIFLSSHSKVYFETSPVERTPLKILFFIGFFPFLFPSRYWLVCMRIYRSFAFILAIKGPRTFTRQLLMYVTAPFPLFLCCFSNMILGECFRNLSIFYGVYFERVSSLLCYNTMNRLSLVFIFAIYAFLRYRMHPQKTLGPFISVMLLPSHLESLNTNFWECEA